MTHFITFYVLTFFPQRGARARARRPCPRPAVRKVVEALAEPVERVVPVEQNGVEKEKK